ncbi:MULTISPECIES: LrgB family protein [Paenibacillus]|uniref:LrgB family protein n=1 Tax=Paenibacillus residui TaxID=629724 RepID=A0ABW3D4G3_9BACL
MIVTSAAMLLLTLLIYQGAVRLYARHNKIWLAPIIIVPVVIIAFLALTPVGYDQFESGGKWLSRMLEPATVALAIPLYKYSSLLKKYAAEIIGSVLFGSLVAIFTSALLAGWMHLEPKWVNSLLPRSVTTPIAMTISQRLGGIPPITAVFVILTGIAGMIIGPLVIRYLPIRSGISKGLLLGVGAHGSGTSKAFEFGPVEGALASLAMIITAMVTIVTAPLLLPFLKLWTG